MRYMGGKFRQSKAIKEHITKRHHDFHYVEPFCGALGSAEKVVPFSKTAVLSDVSVPLVNMWNAMIDDWMPPDTVDEDTYKRYADKRHEPDASDPMTAYCGYAMSFGGKWFGGLARSGDLTARSQTNQKMACLRKIRAVCGVVKRIQSLDYRDALNEVCDGSVVYLDPPYGGRTVAHHTARDFDTAEFWDMAHALSKRCHVYVSEFAAPCGWKPIHVWGDTVVRHGANANAGNTSERLWVAQ